MKAMEFQEVPHARANVTEYEISLAIANKNTHNYLLKLVAGTVNASHFSDQL